MWVKKFIKNKFPFILRSKRSLEDQTSHFNAQLSEIYKSRQLRHPNKLCRFGKRVFCQSDEDGLTLEIIRRMKIDHGNFIELGVGNGTENNTLVLSSLGFSGAWIGGEDLAFKIPDDNKRLFFQQSWVTLDNINKLIEKSLDFLGTTQIDFLSIDLDGNDFYFLKAILDNGLSPKILVCEINGIFPPPISFSVAYDPEHKWLRDDYQGASLEKMNELLGLYDYKLVVCNAATGVNAYFVKNEYAILFPEIPEDIADIYVEPLHINYTGFTFPRSTKTILQIIENGK